MAVFTPKDPIVSKERIVIQSPDVIQNLDVLDLINRIDRYMLEMSRCASATRTETSVHDIKRAADLLSNLRDRFHLYDGPPELDLPKYHPKPIGVPVPPEPLIVENPDVQQLINILSALRIEVSFCDSAERASGFSRADAGRVGPVLDKIEMLIAAITANPEIDTPDVDKQEPSINPGVPH
jgi:hypothetical protein